MKKTYIEILELMLERIDNHTTAWDVDLRFLDLRFDINQMLLKLKKQKTKITNQQVQDIVDLKLRLEKEMKEYKEGKVK